MGVRKKVEVKVECMLKVNFGVKGEVEDERGNVEVKTKKKVKSKLDVLKINLQRKSGSQSWMYVEGQLW